MENIKEQWAELPEWKKLLVVGLVSLAIGYLFYAFVISEKIIERDKLNREVQNLQREVERLKRASDPRIKKRLTRKLKELEQEISMLNQKMEYLSRIIPESENPQLLLKFLSEGVKKSGLILDKFEISKPENALISYKDNKLVIKKTKKNSKTRKDEISLKRVTINLNLYGDLTSLYNFIKFVGKSKRYIRIDNVRLKKSESGLRIGVQLSTFYLPKKRREK